MQLEIAVQNAAGARIASEADVDRVELCSALSLGGVTPSAGVIEAVVAVARCPVHVLVRPRPGDFGYSPDEVAVLLADVRRAVSAGAAGVVVGALADGAVDAEILARIGDAANGADVTFHRAFDLVTDPAAGLDVLAAHRVRRVLSSGAASSAVEGMPGLGRLVAIAQGRVEIMAGGGVTIESIPEFGAIGVAAVHLSAKSLRRVAGGFSLGADSREGVMEWDVTDPQLVARARASVSGSS